MTIADAKLGYQRYEVREEDSVVYSRSSCTTFDTTVFSSGKDMASSFWL